MANVLRVHKHSPEGTVLDQVADCFGRLGHGEDFADCGLPGAFLEVRQQRHAKFLLLTQSGHRA